MNIYLIALGSNLGDKESNLKTAVTEISCRVGKVTAAAPYYQTSPVGGVADQDFLNSAIICQSELSPLELIRVVLDIEKLMGRVRDLSWGNRSIDLDILLALDENKDAIICNFEHLKIPHPLMHKRHFVLIPACNIAKNWVHPTEKRDLESLLNLLPSIIHRDLGTPHVG